MVADTELTRNPPRPEKEPTDLCGDFARIARSVKTDADIAQDLRDEITPHLADMCKILDKARAAGLKVEFQVAQDSFGRHVVPPVMITKAL